ncbi:class I SAM-dependent methyltransferase [Polaromonas sp.]|uniref:class I SAM-dependent methyltransferase n=1 Tax=Polaromonas sp. TaxID=1869339 RepID=UPI0032668144
MRIRDVALPSSSVSSRYIEMSGASADAESARLRGAWQDDDLPQKQRELVDLQLADYRGGAAIDVFDVMVEALRGLPKGEGRTSVLEVGCSSGFYSEVFDIAGLGVNYAGADYSDAFIALARQKYPALRFDVEDATALRYADDAFDVVISGCCLLHIPEYEAAVAETARVARRYAVFHRTPVVLDQPNRYFRKLAYGVETVEIHFNEPQFLELLRTSGLELLKTWTLSEGPAAVPTQAVRTYLCRVT